MKRMLFIIMLLSAPCYAADWNSFDNDSALATDDEFLMYCTSCSPDGNGSKMRNVVPGTVADYTLEYPIAPTAKTENFTWALSDAGGFIRGFSGSAITATVPPNSSEAFPIGTVLPFAMWGGGTLTVAPGSGVTLNGSLNYSSASGVLHKVDTNTWDVYGGAE